MKIELVSSEDRGRYLVSHLRDIQRYLAEVMNGKTLVALYAENGKDFVLSTVLGIDERQGCVFL
ncbi:MAG: flagellar brake protein, partial [Thiobacillaceae bacterium]|nr:flagellar brake protein [Thiobacillaceae bacterium]